jgi:hypothetical protein
MAREYLHEKRNKATFSNKFAMWWSTDAGATWTRLSESAELTITTVSSESETVNNAGRGRFDDVIKNKEVTGKWIERGEDVRLQFTSDTDQSLIDGTYGALWVQGAALKASGGTATYEHHVFYNAKMKKSTTYAPGTGDPMYEFTFYCEANETCADVTISPPSGDDCFASAPATTATVVAGEFDVTFDAAAAS